MTQDRTEPATLNVLMKDSSDKDSYYFDGVSLTFTKDTLTPIKVTPTPAFFGGVSTLNFEFSSKNPYRLGSKIAVVFPSSVRSSVAPVACSSVQFSSLSACPYSAGSRQ